MKLNSEKVKMLLAEREMNQVDLAIKMGSHRQQVSEILDRGSCSLKTLGRLAKALGASVQEIIKEET